MSKLEDDGWKKNAALFLGGVVIGCLLLLASDQQYQPASFTINSSSAIHKGMDNVGTEVNPSSQPTKKHENALNEHQFQ